MLQMSHYFNDDPNSIVLKLNWHVAHCYLDLDIMVIKQVKFLPYTLPRIFHIIYPFHISLYFYFTKKLSFIKYSPSMGTRWHDIDPVVQVQDTKIFFKLFL